MKVFWVSGTKKRDITGFVEQVEWEGSDTQTSRIATISVAYNPYKKVILDIKLGDLLYLKEDVYIFYGVITSTDRTGDIGTVTYTAKDYMHYLLRSTGSYNFKKTTPEKIAKKVCDDLQIGTVALYKTNTYINSLLFEEATYYKIIVDAYNHAARKKDAKNPPAFMPVMNKNKLSVIIKGKSSGVTLKSDADLTKTSYSQNTDDMVNRVKITDEKGKQKGEVKNEKNIRKYGVYQSIYRQEKGVNSRNAARQLLTGITREATVEAVGFRQCMAGYSVKIRDSASGLTGKFYIENDKHTWKDGVHTMNLTLKFKNELEES
ncbi:hypothetical protein C806_00062 [Lachnospiraceae bacterium 3-1]|nr:hypothetical protein C806_00062 [Lachnospiraceae bacterium 3-1]